MNGAEERRARRAAKRGSWPVRRFPLGGEPNDDLSAHTTVQQRLAMMWPLAEQAWRLAGKATDGCPREQLSGRIMRPTRGR